MGKNGGSDPMVWTLGTFTVETTDIIISPLSVVANPLWEKEESISVLWKSSEQLGGFGFEILKVVR